MTPLNQFKTFERLINTYDFSVPLHRFLPDFFRKNRQMGARDRRISSRLLYHYCRLGRALSEQKLLTRLVVADFLCSTVESDFVQYFYPAFYPYLSLPVDEKLQLVTAMFPSFCLEDVFPFIDCLSLEVEKMAFLKSHFLQPSVFIRIHAGKEHEVRAHLLRHSIDFETYAENVLAVPNQTKFNELFSDTFPFEIQDWASQKTGDYFMPQSGDVWWDCCAGSGGKSLLLYAMDFSVNLVVSDVRQSILNNLFLRFKNRGLTSYVAQVLDLTQSTKAQKFTGIFDGVLLDVPCSGSGTWGRNPENITRFDRQEIVTYQLLQRRIFSNVLPHLKVGKPLIYMTCSVFSAENEDNIAFFCNQYGLKLVSQQLIKGYERRADSMFVARLIKN